MHNPGKVGRRCAGEVCSTTGRSSRNRVGCWLHPILAVAPSALVIETGIATARDGDDAKSFVVGTELSYRERI